MSEFLQELRAAASRLRRTPGFSILIIFVLGIGLGGTIFMFGAVKGYLLEPLPFPDSGELMHIENQNLAGGEDSLEVRPLDFLDYRTQQQSFEGLAGFYSGTVNLSGAGAERPERYDGAFVSGNIFSLLELNAHKGRLLQPRDSEPGAADVAVIGYSVWMHRYGGEPDIVGRTIRVNARDTTVVGVTPPEFAFPINERVWVPLRIDPTTIAARDEGTTLEILGRLRDGVTREQASAELNAIAANLAKQHPETNKGRSVLVKPFAHEFIDDGARATILTMFAAVVLILVMACANTANLVLVRAARSTRELTIRSALGASRRHLVTRVLSECLLLSATAAVFGWFLADVAGRAMMSALSAGDAQMPFWVDVSPDARVFVFTIAAATLTTLLAGLLPALRGTRVDLSESLKDGSRGTASTRIGRGLVVFEISLACVLLVCAGLMVRSIVNIDQRDLGVDSSNILLSRMGLFEDKYPSDAARRQFFEALTEDLGAKPGVTHAFAATGLPGGQAGWTKIGIAGEGLLEDQFERGTWEHWTVATPDIFDALSIPLVAGRAFDARDRSDAEPVAVITRTLAESRWPGQETIGRQIALGSANEPERLRTVIGVVEDVHLGDVEDSPRGTVFVPMSQNAARFAYAAIRTAGDPLGHSEDMRQAVLALDPDLPVYWLQTLDYWIEYGAWTSRVIAINFEIFGVIALVLAAVGMYGVLAYSVAQRTREIGVRRALGAADGRIIGQIARQSLGQLGLGIGVGMLLAFGFAQVMRGMLVDVDVADPWTYIGVAMLLVVITAIAAALPTWRALRIDPVVGLRQE
ncbi:MAG: ABC transporter permease [Wenzhouxiangellaceae bacterium]